MLPALFVSHGAPTFALSDAPARSFLEQLASSLERPRAILVVSAHWETEAPRLSVDAVNPTIHDFHGFPAELYAIRYPAPGSASLADDVAALLEGGGLDVVRESGRGLDHGAWVPLRLIYPAADIPVVQLSVQPRLGPDYHYRLGQLLAPLRRSGVLIIGSGSFTHDLSSFRQYYNALHAPAPEWVDQFADWMDDRIEAGRTEDLLAYRQLAPHAARNHPTEEHLLPLYVALGAGGSGEAHHLHRSTTHAILRMDAYSFGDAA
ncbi:class III extradiol ring-cleavage dioxygenase [Sphingomonas sp. BK235]|uniref:DODA-type extradiol aromatic ring-opening family dioxygenase n=1 Tax=Sphingomonas sp. BK235 TaxID=2512131 RepID=UPI001045EDEC|nr:class III extradiol ring-cleavage dioxygenase [Sphingomonas sp. BK235]TCP32442.1 4,5-DOPA dioxygenase extradiol [Sphingomonas sp. BK235]